MRAHLLFAIGVSVALAIATSSEAAADAIPSCPPGQHLVTGTPSSGHHGGGHCEPGADPNAPESASSASNKNKSSGGCAVTTLSTSAPSSLATGGLIALPLAVVALRRLRRRLRRQIT